MLCLKQYLTMKTSGSQTYGVSAEIDMLELFILFWFNFSQSYASRSLSFSFRVYSLVEYMFLAYVLRIS